MTTFISAEEELIHFGIKGMRWGVRRERDSGGEGSSGSKSSAPGTSSKEGSGKGKKVLAGVALAGGLIAAGVVMKKYGVLDSNRLTTIINKDGSRITFARGFESSARVVEKTRREAEARRNLLDLSTPVSVSRETSAVVSKTNEASKVLSRTQNLLAEQQRRAADIARNQSLQDDDVSRMLDRGNQALRQANQNWSASLDDVRNAWNDPNHVWHI